jgi:hypothetical protein
LRTSVCNWRFKRAQDLVRGENRHALAGNAWQQAGKLVAAHPAELVLLAQNPFAHAPGDTQHERFAPLQAKQAIHLLDFLDLDQEQCKLFALLPVGLDCLAEDFHEGRVFGGGQRPHHAASFLAAPRERGENGGLQENEALQRKKIFRAPLRVTGVQPQHAARHRALEAQAIAPHALDRFGLGVQRPFTERRKDRLGAGRGLGIRERRGECTSSRNEQIRRALANLLVHRRDAGKDLGIDAEILRQAPDQSPQADARFLFRPGGCGRTWRGSPAVRGRIRRHRSGRCPSPACA